MPHPHQSLFDSLSNHKSLTPEQADQFLNFVSQHRHLTYKVSEMGPLESLSGDPLFAPLSFTVYDVKIKTRGPDDRIYASTNNAKVPHNDRIRDEITRGCFLVKVHHSKTKQLLFCDLFQGFAKFSGATDEDDDDLSKMREAKQKRKQNHQDESTTNTATSPVDEYLQPSDVLEPVQTEEKSEADLLLDQLNQDTEKAEKDNAANRDPFFIQPYTKSVTMVRTRKENGKACHLASFDITVEDKTRRIFLSGSKNVHIAFCTERDLESHSDALLHVKASRTMLKMMSELTEDNRKTFTDILAHTGLVANFEYMLSDDQHIVDYQLEDHVARLLGMTGRRFNNDEYKKRYGKCINPVKVIEWGRSVGVPVTLVCKQYDFSQENLSALIAEIRKEEQSEGSVIYFVDKNDRVLGLWKLKTQWYILFRAIREKILQFPDDFNKRIKIRLNDIKKWIGLSDVEVASWRVTAHHLFEHHLNLIRENQLEGHRDNVRGSYAVNLRLFLEKFELPENVMEEAQKLPQQVKLSGVKLKNRSNQQQQQQQPKKAKGKGKRRNRKKKR